MTERRAFMTRLPADEHEALKTVARFTGRSMNQVILVAVRAYLAEHPMEEVVKEAQEACERFEATLDRLRLR